MKKISSAEIFCNNVKALRRQSGSTKKAFAEKICISIYALTKIESGEIPSRLGCEVLANISEAFNIDPYILLCCEITD